MKLVHLPWRKAIFYPIKLAMGNLAKEFVLSPLSLRIFGLVGLGRRFAINNRQGAN